MNYLVAWRLIDTRIRIQRELARRRAEVIRAQLIALRQAYP